VLAIAPEDLGPLPKCSGFHEAEHQIIPIGSGQDLMDEYNLADVEVDVPVPLYLKKPLDDTSGWRDAITRTKSPIAIPRVRQRLETQSTLVTGRRERSRDD
jgi:hypothetical protein